MFIKKKEIEREREKRAQLSERRDTSKKTQGFEHLN